MPLLAIINPVCGNRQAKQIFNDHVQPFIIKHGQSVDNVVETRSEGHAGEIVANHLSLSKGQHTVILCSGDGTLHEIINFLSQNKDNIQKLDFILIPCGTANALYHSLFPSSLIGDDPDITSGRFKSLQSYLDGRSTVPLSLAITTLSSAPTAQKRPKFTISSVVVSTSLHACILRDSEALRKEIPGIERFKVAARNNSTRWFNSYVKLLPATKTGYVQIYDPKTRNFIIHPESTADDPIVDVYGPFAYFLSTVNVDRLEAKFRITPLARSLPPSEASCEVVMLRPLRDPAITWDNPEAREAFVEKLWKVLTGAYEDGLHIDLRYNAAGEVVKDGEGPLVIEYLRCGGWEWEPDDLDERAHILCSDGAISEIEKGGRAVCSAATPVQDAGFSVYC